MNRPGVAPSATSAAAYAVGAKTEYLTRPE